ncbi:putative adenylate cyclase [Escherichia coli]|uniref:Putative adenylate cyclase n=1 Tax=Escherichia coli TaxID=562 RepID=A0A2X3LRP2_ECOLX|nr:putative adenylate cyclase [Escherichia coli]
MTISIRWAASTMTRAVAEYLLRNADNWLRGHDMGLRIRGENGRYEMTMKVAGRVTGGLHQRPEYNVALSEPTLDLAQLPTEVWPNGELPADLASRVTTAVQHRFLSRKMAGGGR